MRHIRVGAIDTNNNDVKSIYNNNNIKLEWLHVLFHFPRSSKEENDKEKTLQVSLRAAVYIIIKAIDHVGGKDHLTGYQE